MRLTFESFYRSIAQLPDFDQATVKKEPMLFSADYAFASFNGGPITKAFMETLDPSEHWIIDSRTHMLMPGWYPCIPGWHLDDVPRTRPDGQPDHAAPVYTSKHQMVVVGTTAIPEFAIGTIELDDVPVGEGIVYGIWNEKMKALAPRVSAPKSGEVVAFDSEAFHRGMPATDHSWRFFIRASVRKQTPRNEIRHQVNVYMPAIEGGW